MVVLFCVALGTLPIDVRVPYLSWGKFEHVLPKGEQCKECAWTCALVSLVHRRGKKSRNQVLAFLGAI